MEKCVWICLERKWGVPISFNPGCTLAVFGDERDFKRVITMKYCPYCGKLIELPEEYERLKEDL